MNVNNQFSFKAIVDNLSIFFLEKNVTFMMIDRLTQFAQPLSFGNVWKI